MMRPLFLGRTLGMRPILFFIPFKYFFVILFLIQK
jgi:hypothetical protein